MHILNEICKDLSKLNFDIDFATKINLCEQFTRKYEGKNVELIGKVGGVMPGDDYEGILLISFEFDTYIPFLVWGLVDFPSSFYSEKEKEYRAGEIVKVDAIIKYVCLNSMSDIIFNVVCSAK